MRQTPMVIRTVLRFVAMVSRKEIKKKQNPPTHTGSFIMVLLPQRTGGSLTLEAGDSS
jgi:hypothetical protein